MELELNYILFENIGTKKAHETHNRTMVMHTRDKIRFQLRLPTEPRLARKKAWKLSLAEANVTICL